MSAGQRTATARRPAREADGRVVDAVITGIGIVAPNGATAPEQWAATVERRSGLCRLPDELAGGSGVRVAGVVGAGFDADRRIPQRLRVQTDKWTWMALAAAEEAVADAGLERADLDPYRISVLTAASGGGNEFGQRELQGLWREGPRKVGVYQSIAWFYAACTGQISIRHGFKGRCGVVVADQAGGLVAAYDALGLLRRGGADHVLLGGTEAPLTPYSLVCHASRGDAATGEDPRTVYRPFGGGTGPVFGEGGALMLLETADAAERRGTARRY
ncbi:beta-ketoacyl synthase N-terminal-like domain-containing protein, partial [Streptomyces sp. 4N124]|uniref:beta-ketoacyl synthase N-terminal-like domain-containing protein n=1 Tax=Streptomyces sp. 4N124 TaxID=3457420 RepID=UPI003FD35F7B